MKVKRVEKTPVTTEELNEYKQRTSNIKDITFAKITISLSVNVCKKNLA